MSSPPAADDGATAHEDMRPPAGADGDMPHGTDSTFLVDKKGLKHILYTVNCERRS